jgi:hypothetical protein
MVPLDHFGTLQVSGPRPSRGRLPGSAPERCRVRPRAGAAGALVRRRLVKIRSTSGDLAPEILETGGRKLHVRKTAPGLEGVSTGRAPKIVIREPPNFSGKTTKNQKPEELSCAWGRLDPKDRSPRRRCPRQAGRSVLSGTREALRASQSHQTLSTAWPQGSKLTEKVFPKDPSGVKRTRKIR